MSANLVWMDLEMTGLDPDKDVILEIATIVTDSNLGILAEGPNLAIHQPPEVLERMDDWCKAHHGASGLTRRVHESATSLEQAEALTLQFIQNLCPKGSSPLCGNSIGQDRRFLYKFMPSLSAWLHYRNIDVSTLKELAARWYPELAPPAKSETHLALMDIRESIEELKYYQKHIFINRKPS